MIWYVHYRSHCRIAIATFNTCATVLLTRFVFDASFMYTIQELDRSYRVGKSATPDVKHTDIATSYSLRQAYKLLNLSVASTSSFAMPGSMAE